MGGHANGQFASSTIAKALDAKPIPEDDLEAACEAVADAIHAANAAIFCQVAVEVGKQMGSTFVALVVRDGEFAVLWAGDSRAYLYRDGQLIHADPRSHPGRGDARTRAADARGGRSIIR